jgi:hypothetical protein
MSKRVTTRWFIGAWVVAVLVGVVTGLVARGAPAGSPPPIVTILSLVLIACGIVMFVMWIGALIKQGQQRAWGWFAFVLLLYALTLGVLGIVAMAVYAFAGPQDEGEVVIRPTAT